jgi:hypothetical protein
MTTDKYSIAELASVIHESISYAEDDAGVSLVLPEIIEALLMMAERSEFRVSFTKEPDPEIVHISLEGVPYKSEEAAAKAAESRDDLWRVHYEVIPIKGGWGIQDVTATFDGWYDYSEDKKNKTDGRGDISAEGLRTLGKAIFVSVDDWVTFKESPVFLEWLRSSAPPTEKQKRELLPRSLKAKPSGLTKEQRSKGGSQPKVNLELLDAMQRILTMLDGGAGTHLLSAAMVWEWLCENALVHEPFEFEPVIDGCDYLYVDGDVLHFRDLNGKQYELKRRALDPYISKAKSLFKTGE